MLCAVARTCPNGGRRTIQVAAPSLTSQVRFNLLPATNPAGRPGHVQPGQVVKLRGHHATRTLTVSTTQAGLSTPSRSMVTRAVT